MSALRDDQRGWSLALRDPATFQVRASWSGGRREQAAGFAVYVNSIRGNLFNALAASFPACLAAAGGMLFRSAILQMLREAPPQSGDLGDYGLAFPEVIAEQAPSAEAQLLRTLGRYEWLLDQLPRTPRCSAWQMEQALAVPGEAWSDLQLRLVRHCQLFTTEIPVRAWHRYFLAGGPKPDTATERWLLVGSPTGGVDALPLLKSESKFLCLLNAGADLVTASDAAFEVEENFALIPLLQRLLVIGALKEPAPRLANV